MKVINAWSCYFVELLSRLVSQLTISFHAFLGMTLHVGEGVAVDARNEANGRPTRRSGPQTAP